MAGTSIACDGVVKRFGSVTALDGLDLDVPFGGVVGYLGPNGAGKSTTIRLLLDLSRPDRGQVRVLGTDPREGGPDLRRRIGYLPGELRLDDRLSVEETLRSWSRLRGGVDQAEVHHWCERLGLDPTRRNKGLSTGNRRKVGLVGAFMAKPELLILDEPTSGLDPLVQAEFATMMDEVRDEGRTVFLSSHVLGEVQRVADHVIVLRGGKVVATGSVEELRQLARQPFRVLFADDPPLDELRAASGVSEVRADLGQVDGVVEGDPNGLLAVLANHRVIHLLVPEPDLEDSFLRLYRADDHDPDEPDGPADGGWNRTDGNGHTDRNATS
jgi:ABC-2 type transport system ATP-binding protein